MAGPTTFTSQPMTFSDAIDLLRELYADERRYRKDREGLVNRANNPKYPPGQWDRISEALDNVIANTQSDIEQTLRILQQFPPNHARHFQRLEQFSGTTSYEKSVFVMTKFPESETEEDKRLSEIISIVTDELGRIGLTARIAKGAKYHDWLWDEVEIHLLGCAMGIAIVEDKYRPELNPNVAMEWGWMRALGRRVLFLMEETFSHGRADWGGLRSWEFKWEVPEPGIHKAINEFFGVNH